MAAFEVIEMKNDFDSDFVTESFSIGANGKKDVGQKWDRANFALEIDELIDKIYRMTANEEISWVWSSGNYLSFVDAGSNLSVRIGYRQMGSNCMEPEHIILESFQVGIGNFMENPANLAEEWTDVKFYPEVLDKVRQIVSMYLKSQIKTPGNKIRSAIRDFLASK